MKPEDVRRWAAGQRAGAHAADAAELSGPAPPAIVWQQALSLLALLDQTVGWPVRPDETRRREDERAASAWTRLRAFYREGR